MAMIQRCSAAARRVASAVEQRMAFSSLASSMVAPPGDAIVCGRGDKKTKKGKRFKGSFGNCRPKKDKKIERIKDKIEVPRVEVVRIMQYRLLSILLVVGFVVVSDMLSFLFLLCGARSFVIEEFSLS